MGVKKGKTGVKEGLFALYVDLWGGWGGRGVQSTADGCQLIMTSLLVGEMFDWLMGAV
jgi:hypothetical protein